MGESVVDGKKKWGAHATVRISPEKHGLGKRDKVTIKRLT